MNWTFGHDLPESRIQSETQASALGRFRRLFARREMEMDSRAAGRNNLLHFALEPIHPCPHLIAIVRSIVMKRDARRCEFAT
jgi:hypothetical protein